MSEPVLSANGVAKAFPDGRETRQVLSDVSIEVGAGRVVGLQGPSGCGKSTLLAILGGLLAYDRGRVVLAGTELDYARPRDVARLRREHVGLISQTYGLLSAESVATNVTLPLMYDRPKASRRERRAILDRALEAAALDVDPRVRVATLSQGQQQRVAIARALVRQPTILLADEPTAALDPVAAGRIVERFRHLANEGVGVLVATHDQRVASACDEVYEMGDGQFLRITAEATACSGGV